MDADHEPWFETHVLSLSRTVLELYIGKGERGQANCILEPKFLRTNDILFGMKEGPENLSRRTFLAGSGAALGAMALGIESADAKVESGFEKTDAIRKTLTDLFTQAIPLLREFDVAELNQYSTYVERLIGGELLVPGDHALTRAFTEIYNTYADYENGTKQPPNETTIYARQAIDTLSSLINKHQKAAEAKGLRGTYEKLREHIGKANTALREILQKK